MHSLQGFHAMDKIIIKNGFLQSAEIDSNKRLIRKLRNNGQSIYANYLQTKNRRIRKVKKIQYWISKNMKGIK